MNVEKATDQMRTNSSYIRFSNPAVKISKPANWSLSASGNLMGVERNAWKNCLTGICPAKDERIVSISLPLAEKEVRRLQLRDRPWQVTQCVNNLASGHRSHVDAPRRVRHEDKYWLSCFGGAEPNSNLYSLMQDCASLSYSLTFCVITSSLVYTSTFLCRSISFGTYQQTSVNSR